MILALKNFRTYHLAVEFYQACKPLKLSPSLKDQLTRASESIVLTLAEGSAKPTAKDRARFYSIALGSFRECQCILSLNGQTEFLLRFDRLGGCLYKLARALRLASQLPVPSSQGQAPATGNRSARNLKFTRHFLPGPFFPPEKHSVYRRLGGSRKIFR